MDQKWDEEQLNLFEMQANGMDSNAPSTETIPSEKPGLKLTKQLDFQELWEYRLEVKYGIRPAFAEDDDE